MPAQKRALPENCLGEEEEEDRHEEDFNRDVLQLISPIPKQICLEHVEAAEEEDDDDGDDDENEDVEEEEEEMDKADGISLTLTLFLSWYIPNISIFTDSDESPSSSPVLKPEYYTFPLFA